MWNVQVTWAHICKFKNCDQNCQILPALEVWRKERTEGRAKICCRGCQFQFKMVSAQRSLSGLQALAPLYFSEVTISSRLGSSTLPSPSTPLIQSGLPSPHASLPRPGSPGPSAQIQQPQLMTFPEQNKLPLPGGGPSARDQRSDTPGPQHVKIRSQMSRTCGHYPVPEPEVLPGC